MKRDGKEYRILIIEDNPGDLIIVEELLYEQILSPQISKAVDFSSAKKMLASGEDRFDIILLDLTLPDKSGGELITEMLQITSVPVIILTGYSDIGFSIHSISQGIFDYLLKDELTAAMLYKSITYSIERKKNISAYRDSEKQYSDLFHLSPQPMWVFDPFTLRYLQVNKAAVDLYGFSEEEFLNMKLIDLRAENIKLTEEDISEIRNPEYSFYKRQVKHRKKSGEIIDAEVYSTPIKTATDFRRLSIAIDITEKKIYENKITRAIIKTQEDERYEIGSELHDNVCQLLATSQISLGLIKDAVKPERVEFFNQGREYITMALDEIRSLSHRLAPAFFDNSTLEEAFLRLLSASNIDGRYEISLHFHPSVNREMLGDDIQLNLYRILQEQLRNISKYAKATKVSVEVNLAGHLLIMIIKDNGKGFNTTDIQEGIGLANMKRRAELFAGTFSVISSPGNGCEIRVEIPLHFSEETPVREYHSPE